jgi:hypothetical protein
MISICMSHCACNAGDKAGFVILDRFWKLLQTAFSQSDNAKALWKNTTDKTWEEYSDTRWFSKYDVMKLVATYFPDMKTVLTQMLEGKVSKQSTPSLLKMLTDDFTRFYLEIELSAIIENLSFLRLFCYTLEGDGDLVFQAGKLVDQFFAQYSGEGELCNMPSTNRLIDKAVAWAQDNNLQPPDEPALRLTIHQVREAARATPGHIVNQAANVHETDADRLIRRQLEENEIDAAEAAAIAVAAAAQARNPPLTKQEWIMHIKSGILPAIHYLKERLAEGGDRYSTVEFYRGARIFDPLVAKNLTSRQANILIDKLTHMKSIKAETLDHMKETFNVYKERAQAVSSEVDILQWHCDWTWFISDSFVDCHECKYCRGKSCFCEIKYKSWFDAIVLVVLVQPSSAAAERVFSLVSSLFNQQQERMMSDVMRSSLYLRYNNRKL